MVWYGSGQSQTVGLGHVCSHGGGYRTTQKDIQPTPERRGCGTPHSKSGGDDRNGAWGGEEADGARRKRERDFFAEEGPPPVSLTP